MGAADMKNAWAYVWTGFGLVTGLVGTIQADIHMLTVSLVCAVLMNQERGR